MKGLSNSIYQMIYMKPGFKVQITFKCYQGSRYHRKMYLGVIDISPDHHQQICLRSHKTYNNRSQCQAASGLKNVFLSSCNQGNIHCTPPIISISHFHCKQSSGIVLPKVNYETNTLYCYSVALLNVSERWMPKSGIIFVQ